MSLVDVLIPVYNAAATLKEAVSSVCAQTERDIRIVIVDDGSTDDSVTIIEEIAGVDDRVMMLRKVNGGLVAALNFGLARCTAPFVARFDADDACYPDRFARQLRYMESDPACVAVGGSVDHMDDKGAPLHGLPFPGPAEEADPTALPAREPYIIHPFLMARRSALVRVGGYRQVHYSEDTDLYWRLREFGTLHNLPDKLGRYRVSGSSISSASIVNGRIMAVFSQLAAISAERRRLARPDLNFEVHQLSSYRADRSLEAMILRAGETLDDQERAHLRAAASAKLLELAGYRPYELEFADCAFVTQSCETFAVSTANRRHLDWQIVRAGARLLRAGKLKEALALTPPRLRPKLIYRTAFPAPSAGSR